MRFVVAALTSPLNGTAAVGPLGWNEPTWIAIGAIAGFLAALATFWLALSTRKLARSTAALASSTLDEARSTKAAMEQAERLNRRSLVPIVTIEGSIRSQGVTLDFSGLIRNVGPGPAIDVDVYINPDTARAAHKRLSSIAAGEVWELNLSWTGLNEPSHLDYLPYRAIVMFWSIFETRGYTRLHCYSGIRADAIVEELVLPTSPGEVSSVEQEQLQRNPAPARNGITNRLP